MPNHLVLQDTSYAHGTLVDDQNSRIVLARRGSSIPVSPTILNRHAIAGFQERHWGEGVALDPVKPSRIVGHALVLAQQPSAQRIHWRARLIATEVAPFDYRCGDLRLDVDLTGIANAGALGIAQANSVDLSKLGDTDEDGGWWVGGSAPVTLRIEGLSSFALRGWGRGVKLVYSAISQAE